MDLNKLLAKKYVTVHEQYIDNTKLTVKQTADYRWFDYGGEGIQSLMSLHQPDKILTPVSQSLLLFLLWNNKPLKLLNLGLGGATIERALQKISSISVTSVELSQPVIDMANQYFYLEKGAHVVCQSAEYFIQTTPNKYDIVVCDLFNNEKSPGFLFTQQFYTQLNKITHSKAIVMINIQADTDQQLLTALYEIKKRFSYIALIEFNDYKNIVVVCSTHEIPERDALQKKLSAFKCIDLAELASIIPHIRYIPYSL